MSSRSIGVTKVSLRRRMMSCVIRSPSCSQMRMSSASSERSGKAPSIWSSRSAARTMFPPASSNRSKYWRSRETSSCDRGGIELSWIGTAAECKRVVKAPSDEGGPLDPAGHRLGPAGPEPVDHAARRRLGRLVPDAPVFHAAVFAYHRVGRARVAVEGHAHAAGVDQLDASARGGLAAERKVRVPEHEATLLDAGEQL